MVNILNSAAQAQAQAMVAAEGAQLSGLLQDLNKTEVKEAVKKSDWMEKLMQTGDAKDLSGQLIKELVGKVAQAGISLDSLAPQSKVKGEKKEDQSSSRSEGESGDKVQLSVEKDPNLPVKGIGEARAKFERSRKDVQAKWEETREELIKQGKSKEEIAKLEAQFKANETKDYMRDLIKESAVLYYLESGNKIREMIRERGFNDAIKKSEQEEIKAAVKDAQEEVKSFVLHEIENQLIKRTFLQDGNFDDCIRLVEIGRKAGVDAMEWTTQYWPQKKVDQGLNLLDIPHEVTGYINLKDYDSDSRREWAKQREQYEYKEDDEKDVMLNRLRAHYMQLALRPGVVHTAISWVKIRTLKNGIQRLCVFTKDMDEKIQEEAKTLAKIKTMEILEEAMLENASHFDPLKEHTLQNKIKNCVKNLDRLGLKLDDKEFMEMRDKANERIYGLIQKEIEQTKQKQGRAAEQRLQELQKLSARLQKESNLSLKEEV